MSVTENFGKNELQWFPKRNEGCSQITDAVVGRALRDEMNFFSQFDKMKTDWESTHLPLGLPAWNLSAAQRL